MLMWFFFTESEKSSLSERLKNSEVDFFFSDSDFVLTARCELRLCGLAALRLTDVCLALG